MKLHFFTVNKAEEYRKHYKTHSLAKKIFEEYHPQTPEDFDQLFFSRCMKAASNVSDEDLESEIFFETGIDGLRLDFNCGLRLDVPEGNFQVRISDFDTGRVCLDKYISGGRIISVENYFIRWHVEVFLNDEKIFTHTLSLEGQPVLIIFKNPALGDTLCLVPYFEEFRKINRCKLSVATSKPLREFISRLCPAISLVDEADFKTYATYRPKMLGANPFIPVVPVDIRQMSMTRMGGMLLGIDYLPPKIEFKPTEPPVTDAPYVCIGVQARNTYKGWHYPNGWDIVVDYLKRLGYRIFCIDMNAKVENGGLTICKPEGAEDFTGDRPLLERANMLSHAEFFIGLGSGLSWLADAVNCPVVMICGFSREWFEFYTPYRVANRKVCNGCMNDMQVSLFTNKCPYHKNTPREMECQKEISPRMVINAIERLIVDRKLIPPALKNF